LFLPSITLNASYFSDVGYRYRINNFDDDIKDDWRGVSSKAGVSFTDYTFFNKDTFEQDPEDEKSNVLQEIYFRLAVEKIEH